MNKKTLMFFVILVLIIIGAGYKMTGNVVKEQPTKILLKTNIGGYCP